MTTKHVVIAALLAGLFAPALAEDAQGRASDGAMTFHFDSMNVDARTGVAVMRSNIVKTAPYSAQMVTEFAQALADGNQIATRRTTMTYRDSAGRTRQEIRDDKGDVVTVTINDPVSGTNLILHPQNRTAVRINPGATARAAADAARAKVDQMRKDGTLPAGSQDIIVKRVQGIDDAERQRIQRDVRIQVSRALAENGTALRDMQMQVAPLMNGAFADVKWSTKAATKDLGTRDFGGIKAEGKLRSYEIPAGAIGNRNAIVVADETWTAPDLQVTVYTKHSDPRSGDVVFRLENIKREEPAPALFTVPADYTVREAGGRWRDRIGRPDK
ncbi:hypothetical protein [Massilia sp. Root1485]|uniref:hypothetical protein n=1 Tax=Massilia sp. Root1485 TaxID=1736472 RepID=UPI0009E9E8F9|nr:hypothetical protein [Massilia sp. Root1485]